MKKIIFLCFLGLLFIPLVSRAETTNIDIKDFYEGSKVGKKIVFVGDSTTQVADDMYNVLSISIPGAEIINRGSNGNTIVNYLNNVSVHGNGNSKVIADQADLYVFSYGINDIRCGVKSPCRNQKEIENDLKRAIDELLSKTNAFILLRVPNPFLSSDPTNTGWVQPLENANEYSKKLREIYLSFVDYNKRVDVIDIQSIVFGQNSLSNHSLMNDIVHPNSEGYEEIGKAIAARLNGGDSSPYYDHISSSKEQELIEMCRVNYKNAKTKEEREKWHDMANAIRAINTAFQ
ncbi:hypothetical protein AMS62_03090 [Bacillus sp. FJAT-18019]|nr:hypothetical protein AMS62_03090 [Bacillus sp. FJAT-18019]